MITVTPNTLPVANSQIYGTPENGGGFSVSADSGVLAGDADPEGESLTAVLDSAPNNGTLCLNSDGSFQYTPNQNFVGQDSFVYQAVAADGRESAPALVQIVVAAGQLAGATTRPWAVPGNSEYDYITQFTPTTRDNVPLDKINAVITDAIGTATSAGHFRYYRNTEVIGAGVYVDFKNQPADVKIAVEYEKAGVQYVSAPLTVYVVEVKVATPTLQQAKDKFGYPAFWTSDGSGRLRDNPPYNLNGPVPGKGFITGNGGIPGFLAQAAVTFIGPGPNQSLGVDQISAGFVQHATFVVFKGHYAGVNKWLVSKFQGNTYLDVSGNGAGPLYSARARANANGAALGANATDIIFFSDQPQLQVPAVFSMNKADLEPANSGTANYLNELMITRSYTVDVVASTKAAPGIYYAQASANFGITAQGPVVRGKGLTEEGLISLIWEPNNKSKITGPNTEAFFGGGSWFIFTQPRLEQTSGPTANSLPNGQPQSWQVSNN
jgi:hypothetical protein